MTSPLYSVGIDVSKHTLDAALADAAQRCICWDRRTPNTREGICSLLANTPLEAAWVVEPTGPYSLLVVQEARRAGRTVLLAPTLLAKKYAESHSSRAKTDKTSARSLAFFGLERRLSPYPLKSPAVDEIEQLLCARRGLAQALTDLSARAHALPRAAASLQESVQALQAQLVRLDRQIQEKVRASSLSDLAQRLDAIPGIGPVTAVAWAARLGSKEFAHPDKWVAYCGLDIAVRQSGLRQGQRGLTKQGDAELRRLAYVCAQAAVRAKESPFRSQFERERAKGLTKVAAYCAVARKLLTVAWALAHHQTSYDAARVALAPAERRKQMQGQADPTEAAGEPGADANT